MTVPARAARNIISGTGWVNPLEWANVVLESTAHIEVWADDTLLVLGTDYSVIAAAGSEVPVQVGLNDPAGFGVELVDEEMVVTQFILILRPPITQNADLSSGGRFGIATEDALDAIVRRLQATEDRVNRAIKTEITEAVDSDDMTIEKIAVGRVWKADAGGNMVDGGVATDVAAAVAAVEAAETAAIAAVEDAEATVIEAAEASALAAIGVLVDDAETAAGTATTQAGIATTQAGIATTQAGIATTQAGLAAASEAAADDSADTAAASALLAAQWAEEDEDVEVTPGLYSAKHWALQAQESAGEVTSVNGYTGAVTLSATDVGAYLVGGALGTPASATLTNATGLPMSGLVASTSQAIGVGSVDVGHASDTTISRSAAGVIAVEGVVVPTISSTSTLTNKRITERVFTITDGAGFSIDPTNGDTQRIVLGANRTPTVANWSDGDSVTLLIDDGTAYTITWSTIGVVWKGGSAPTLALTGFTEVNIYRENSVYRGVHVGDFAS